LYIIFLIVLLKVFEGSEDDII